MSIAKLNINEFLSRAPDHLIIDVRSPAEYMHAHFPGAINIPLFSNEERAAVGTAYKQESREKAIKIGLDFFGPKMSRLVEEAEHASSSFQQESAIASQFPNPNPKSHPAIRINHSLLIYCWRGGMRSAAVAWLLDLYGFKVHTLEGGYKTFRNFVLSTFQSEYNFKILGGFTGSGKTALLTEIEKRGETVINLEKIAQHKGSAFGNIGLPLQPSQEMFENLLAIELHNRCVEQSSSPGKKEIWLEDESQRIGLVNIPPPLWKTMRRSPLYFLDIEFESRLDHIVEEYGMLDKEKMIAAIERIAQRLGSLEARNAITHLSMGKTRESFRILLTYYDRWYLKGLHNREGLNSLLQMVKCESVTPLNAKKLLPLAEYHEKP